MFSGENNWCLRPELQVVQPQPSGRLPHREGNENTGSGCIVGIVWIRYLRLNSSKERDLGWCVTLLFQCEVEGRSEATEPHILISTWMLLPCQTQQLNLATSGRLAVTADTEISPVQGSVIRQSLRCVTCESGMMSEVKLVTSAAPVTLGSNSQQNHNQHISPQVESLKRLPEKSWVDLRSGTTRAKLCSFTHVVQHKGCLFHWVSDGTWTRTRTRTWIHVSLRCVTRLWGSCICVVYLTLWEREQFAACCLINAASSRSGAGIVQSSVNSHQ